MSDHAIYTHPSIFKTMESELRTWISVSKIKSDYSIHVSHGHESIIQSDLLKFTFSTLGDAMAFRLRFFDYVVDGPRDFCASLMALEGPK